MKKSDFIQAVTGLVWVYINNEDLQGKSAHITVNPETLYVDLLTQDEFHQALADNEEAFEDAAYAQGDETESASDFQEKENPDFYLVQTLIKKDETGKEVPDAEAIEKVASNYF